jgi:hypothetical protein
VRLSPRDAADGAVWVQGLAWQGGEHRLVTAPMRRVAPGVFRTTEPLPVHGTWKSLVRVSTGRVRMSLPVHLPADPAIPVPAIAARDGATRAFADDLRLLQRERRDDVAGWLWPAASTVVAALVAGILGLALWALLRLARAHPPAPPRDRHTSRRRARRPRPRERVAT